MTSKQSSGGGAAVAQPGTSQVSAIAGSGDRILGMLNMGDRWIHVYSRGLELLNVL